MGGAAWSGGRLDEGSGACFWQGSGYGCSVLHAVTGVRGRWPTPLWARGVCWGGWIDRCWLAGWLVDGRTGETMACSCLLACLRDHVRAYVDPFPVGSLDTPSSLAATALTHGCLDTTWYTASIHAYTASPTCIPTRHVNHTASHPTIPSTDRRSPHPPFPTTIHTLPTTLPARSQASHSTAPAPEGAQETAVWDTEAASADGDQARPVAARPWRSESAPAWGLGSRWCRKCG